MAFETAGASANSSALLASVGSLRRLDPAAILSFRGCASRSEFWAVIAATLAIGGLVDTALQLLVPLDAFGRPSLLAMAVSSLAWTAAAWLQSAVIVRRMRHRGWAAPVILAWCVVPPLVLVLGLAFAPLLVCAGLLIVWQVVDCGFLPGGLPPSTDMAS